MAERKSFRCCVAWPFKRGVQGIGFGLGVWRNDMRNDGTEVLWSVALGPITIYMRYD